MGSHHRNPKNPSAITGCGGGRARPSLAPNFLPAAIRLDQYRQHGTL